MSLPTNAIFRYFWSVTITWFILCLDQLTCKPQGTLLSLPAQTWDSQLRSLCFHGKHFTISAPCIQNHKLLFTKVRQEITVEKLDIYFNWNSQENFFGSLFKTLPSFTFKSVPSYFTVTAKYILFLESNSYVSVALTNHTAERTCCLFLGSDKSLFPWLMPRILLGSPQAW